jgi:hypothetical protein
MSIWGSAEGSDWGTKPLLMFPQSRRTFLIWAGMSRLAALLCLASIPALLAQLETSTLKPSVRALLLKPRVGTVLIRRQRNASSPIVGRWNELLRRANMRAVSFNGVRIGKSGRIWTISG